MEEGNEEEDKAYLIKDQEENQEEDEKRDDEGEKPLLERVSSNVQTNEEELEETLEEILVEANKGDMLTLNTHHPPRSHEHLSLPTTFYESQAHSSIPPTPKALTQNFCQKHSKPLLTTPNFELRVSEEVVRDTFHESPMPTIPINKGKVRKRVSKFKRDLFDWLILFQPELE